MQEIAALLPAPERFDGHGGAIATWVLETYSRSRHSTIVACPHASSAFAGPVPLARLNGYNVYDRGVRAVSTLLYRPVQKPFLVVYNRLRGSDTIWVRSALRRIGEASLIHIHNRPHHARQLRRAGYRGRILLHMHNDLRNYMERSQIDDIFPHLDGIAFCSDYMRELARAEFGPMPGEAVIPNGVAQSYIDRTIERRPSHTLRLASVGRIIPEKGTLEAVGVCAELRRRGLDARLDIVGGTGSGSDNGMTRYMSDVRKAAQSVNSTAGSEVVRLLGPLPHKEVFRVFSENDVFLLPCTWEEPFGMVALEAMARGCVPFVSARGGLPGVVDGGGITVHADFTDTQSIVRAFADALEQRALPGTLINLRDAGWRRADQLTWESVTESTDAVFDGVLAGR